MLLVTSKRAGDLAVRLARALRAAWTVVILIGVVGFVAGNGRDLAEPLSRSADLRVAPAIAAFLLSCLGILNRASKSRASHRAVGLKVPPRSMLVPTMIGFSADKVVRFGGLSGLAVMIKHGDRVGYAKPAVLASTVVAKVANTMSLGVLLAFTSVLLGLRGSLDRWWLVVAGGFGVYLTTAGAAFLVAAKNRDVAERLWRGIERRAPRASRKIVGQEPIGVIAAGLGCARSNRARTVQVLMHATLAKVLGACILAAASFAVGVPLRPTDAFLVYSTVLLASLSSITPAGVGAVEASAVALIAGLGNEVGDAVAIVAVFRLFDLWLPLAVGGVAAATTKNRRRFAASDTPTAEPEQVSPAPERPTVTVNYCS